MSARRRLRWMLPPLATLALLYAPALLAQAPGSAATDPFAELHADLGRAADFHLNHVAETARRATESATSFTLRPGPPSQDAFAVDASLEKLRGARERLQALGVDAGRIFTEEGVPLELLLVAEVESKFNPLALSPKGARGVWQLMPETAVRFGLRVDDQVDDRIHVVRSTRAAARYLRELLVRFGDWRLALAAYNAGEARIEQAIARAGTRDFRQLAALDLLPAETRRYVPAVLAAMRKL